MSLNSLRRKIDGIDKRIVDLLNARARVILEVGRRKMASGASVYCPDREREVLRKIVLHSHGPLSRAALEAIYREIMSAGLSLEKRVRVAYLGPESSFTHQAALKRFGSQVEFLACPGIADVFAEVEKGNADFGVVPIENSVEGAVFHTMDMLVDSDLKICAQVILDVAHNLLATGPLRSVRKIYSKDQVFGQCRLWLQKHMPQAELIEVSSTSRAAQIAASQKNSAAIASALAARMYRLRVLARSIEDYPHNITRFLVIGTTEGRPTGNDKTSLLFSIKDKVGALHDMLVPFKKHRVNLNKIESRPSKKRAWDYYFFVDLQGHQDEPRVRLALKELETRSKFLKILGSYPSGD